MPRKIIIDGQEVAVDPRWIAVKKRLASAKRIIDLGCGADPVKGASVGVDALIEPEQREDGSGPRIDPAALKQRGVTFLEARIDAALPFADKAFDFAYSHHVFEHLADPAMACREMMRIARSGVIITPSVFSEFAFGRPYHKWLVINRGSKLCFFRKRADEDRPFGETPTWNERTQTFEISDRTNPFDMLLNDGGWYDGRDGEMPALSRTLRRHWYTHSPVTEMIFLWEGDFLWEVYE